jgi:hypothetical protein
MSPVTGWLLLMFWSGWTSQTGGVAAPTMIEFQTQAACEAMGARLAARFRSRGPTLVQWECIPR